MQSKLLCVLLTDTQTKDKNIFVWNRTHIIFFRHSGANPCR